MTLAALGCSDYVGTAAPADASRDVGEPSETAPCALPRLACDPVLQLRCAASMTCAPRAFPVREAECVAAGARAIGEGCTRADECVAGLLCVQGRCVKPCCPASQVDPCAALASGARCVGRTPDDIVTVCGILGECDYRVPGSCGAGRECRPRNELGGAVCVASGGAGLDARCADPEDCAAGLTCVLFGAAGRCRPVCNPLRDACAPPTYCSRFGDRPRDFGACLE